MSPFGCDLPTESRVLSSRRLFPDLLEQGEPKLYEAVFFSIGTNESRYLSDELCEKKNEEADLAKLKLFRDSFLSMVEFSYVVGSPFSNCTRSCVERLKTTDLFYANTLVQSAGGTRVSGVTDPRKLPTRNLYIQLITETKDLQVIVSI